MTIGELPDLFPDWPWVRKVFHNGAYPNCAALILNLKLRHPDIESTRDRSGAAVTDRDVDYEIELDNDAQASFCASISYRAVMHGNVMWCGRNENFGRLHVRLLVGPTHAPSFAEVEWKMSNLVAHWRNDDRRGVRSRLLQSPSLTQNA